MSASREGVVETRQSGMTRTLDPKVEGPPAADPPLESRFRSGFGAVLGGNLVNRLLGIALSIWLARYLGQADFGRLSYVQAYLGFFALIPAFGLDRILSRELARRPEQAERVLASGFFIKSVLAVPAATAAMIVPLFAPVDGELRLLLALGGVMLLGCIAQPLFSIFESSLRLGVPVAFDVLWGLVGLLVVAGAMLGGAGFLWVGVALLVFGRPGNPGPGTILTGWLLARRHVRLGIRYDRETCWYLARTAAPIALSSALVMIASRVDQLLIHPLIGSEALGRYAVAARVTEASSLVASALIIVLVPLMAHYAVADPVRLERSYRLCFRYLSAAAVAMLAVAVIAAGDLLALVFGNEYRAAAMALQLLVVAQLFIFWLAVVSPFLIATDRIRRVLAVNAVNAAANLALNLWWIPRFGIAGAAAATLVSFGLACATLFLWKGTRRFAAAMWASGARPGIAFGFAWAGATLLRMAGAHPLAAAGAGLILYTGALMVIGGLSPSELRHLVRRRIPEAVADR